MKGLILKFIEGLTEISGMKKLFRVEVIVGWMR